jgi:hypothetical protein
MDLVYICRGGDNEELRYSIRSAMKNLPHDKIWVVGGKPDWYTGHYLPVEQSRAKYTNARNNLKALCNEAEISDSFILMNDDFYIINKVKDIPYMHSGSITKKIDIREDVFSANSYTALLKQTLGSLSRRGNHVVLDYELHVPMVMEKKKLLKVLKLSGLWRSVYGNIFEVGGLEIRDVKVYDKSNRFYSNSYDFLNPKYDYLSSNDDSFEMLKDAILNKSFSQKTVYEA